MSISGEQYRVASRFYNQRQGSIMSPRRKQYYVLCRNTSGGKVKCPLPFCNLFGLYVCATCTIAIITARVYSIVKANEQLDVEYKIGCKRQWQRRWKNMLSVIPTEADVFTTRPIRTPTIITVSITGSMEKQSQTRSRSTKTPTIFSSLAEK